MNIDNADLGKCSMVFKALSDPNRLRIVLMLKNGELCACKILELFSITQPTLSHHMKTLVDAGIVNVEQVGKWSHYSLDSEGWKTVRIFLDELGV